MVLFLVSSSPLIYALTLSLFRRLSHSSLHQLALKGLFWFAPVFAVFLLTKNWFPFSYRFVLLFLSNFIENFFIHHVFTIGGFVLIFGYAHRGCVHPGCVYQDDETYVFLSFFSFSCGYHTLANLIDYINNYPNYDVPTLFIIPAFRVCIILWSALFLAKIYSSKELRSRLYLIGLLSLLPAIATFGVYLFEINFTIISLSLTVALSMGTTASMIALFTDRKRLLRTSH